MESAAAFIRSGRTRKTIRMPPCDPVQSPLSCLLMNKESSENPTESLSGNDIPRSPDQQKPTGNSKKKLDLQFECLSSRATPEGDPKMFRKLQSYWEKKSAGMSDLSVLNSDTEPEKNPQIIPATTDRSVFKGMKSAFSLLKSYTQVVMNASNNFSDESLLECQENNKPYQEDITIPVCTPAPQTSPNDFEMTPPSSSPSKIRTERQSRSRDRTPGSTPRSKSTGDIFSCEFPLDFSRDDLTPKISCKRKNYKQARPRRLLSLDPITYSQLIYPDELTLSISEKDNSRENDVKKPAQNIPTVKADEREVVVEIQNIPFRDQNQCTNANDSWPDIKETPDKFHDGKSKSCRKASLETMNLADISEIQQLENTSIREFNDSTFIGDITFDLRGMSAFTDESYLSNTQTFEQSSLAPDVKETIYDIVDEFITPGFLPSIGKATPVSIKNRDLQDMGEINYHDDEAIFREFVDIALQLDNMVQSTQEEHVSDQLDNKLSAGKVADHVNTPENILEGNGDSHAAENEHSAAVLTKMEKETMVQYDINHLAKDLDPCYSPDLRCHESFTESPQYVDTDINWSPLLSLTETNSILSEIWTDTENKRHVLKNRSNLKRPRKLVFDTPENQNSLEDSEPSPKLAKTPVTMSKNTQSNKIMNGVTYAESDKPLNLTLPIEPVDTLVDSYTSYSSCDSCDAIYINTSTSSESSDSDFSYCQNLPQISGKYQGKGKKGLGHTPPTDCPTPILKPPYTRFSSPSYSSDEGRMEALEPQQKLKIDKQSALSDVCRLPYWSLDSHVNYVESVMVNNRLSGDLQKLCDDDNNKHKVVQSDNTEEFLMLTNTASQKYLGTPISKTIVNDTRDCQSLTVNDISTQNDSNKQQTLSMHSEVVQDTGCPSRDNKLNEPSKYMEVADSKPSVQRSVNWNEATTGDKQNYTEIPETYQPNLLQNYQGSYHRDSGFYESMPLYNMNWNSSPVEVEEVQDTSAIKHQPPSVFGTVYKPVLFAQRVDPASYRPDYNTAYMLPSNQVSQFAQNCYNYVHTMKYWDQSYVIQTRNQTSAACLYTDKRSETYLLPDSMFNSTVTIPLQQSTPAEKYSQTFVTPAQQTKNSNNPVQTPSIDREPAVTQPSNNLEVKAGGSTDRKNKRKNGIFGMMADSIKKKLANKFCKPGLLADNFELFDSLKHCHPYLISGWLSSTYLMSLVNKQDFLNSLFQEPLDNSGHIHQWIVDTCRKNTAAIFARDLLFRVFTLEELNNFSMLKLNRKKMAALRKCVKDHFPTMTKWNWKSKCIPLIKSSVSTLFKHRVKQVQLFLMMHSR